MVVFLAVGVSAVSARVLSCLAVSSSSSQRKRKPEEEVSFYRVLQNAWPTAGASFLSRCFFFGLFFWSFLLRSCTFVDDEREPQKKTQKTFVVVSIYSFLFIYFFIVLSPQITQKEKIALVLISLHFFFTRGDDDDDARFFTPGSGC